MNLYCLGTRYYDAKTCRFINADKFVSTGIGVLGNNLFAYCENNPVNNVDYTGTLVFSIFIVTEIVGKNTALILGNYTIVFEAGVNYGLGACVGIGQKTNSEFL